MQSEVFIGRQKTGGTHKYNLGVESQDALCLVLRILQTPAGAFQRVTIITFFDLITFRSLYPNSCHTSAIYGQLLMALAPVYLPDVNDFAMHTSALRRSRVNL
ncbi:MAG: hypothetical protein HXY43_17530 [Fischerella sp.]|uniref:hypothetical protein n=1 Tax=Fischerella sp. TaxID=1191 RepID=UPI00180ECAD3|nr:hypothetical protein [Fischerella sp.]NWF61006.1 hypothetical protein [Fischerella sp.]